MTHRRDISDQSFIVLFEKGEFRLWGRKKGANVHFWQMCLIWLLISIKRPFIWAIARVSTIIFFSHYIISPNLCPNLPYFTFGVLKKLFLDLPPQKFFCRPLKGLLWKSDSKIWSENVFGHCGIAFTFLLFSKKNPKRTQNFQKKIWPPYNNFFEILKKPDDSRHSKLRFEK